MVATQSGGTEVRLASQAEPPAEPTGPRKLPNVAIAGMLGLTLGVFGVFALEWWQGEGDREAGIQGEQASRETREQAGQDSTDAKSG